MNITIEMLIECVEKSKRTITVAVQSQDYYRRPRDVEFETLEYINPYQLISELQEKLDENI